MQIREVERIIFSPEGVIVVPLPGRGEEPITFHAREILVEFRIYKDLGEIIADMDRKFREAKLWP